MEVWVDVVGVVTECLRVQLYILLIGGDCKSFKFRSYDRSCLKQEMYATSVNGAACVCTRSSTWC